jgi:hypothetical protein
MNYQGNNRLILQRKHNLGMLESMCQQYKGKPRKYIIANFAMQTGVSIKKAEEYYDILVNLGRVKDDSNI